MVKVALADWHIVQYIMGLRMMEIEIDRKETRNGKKKILLKHMNLCFVRSPINLSKKKEKKRSPISATCATKASKPNQYLHSSPSCVSTIKCNLQV